MRGYHACNRHPERRCDGFERNWREMPEVCALQCTGEAARGLDPPAGGSARFAAQPGS